MQLPKLLNLCCIYYHIQDFSIICILSITHLAFFRPQGEILNSTDGAEAGSPQFVCKPGASNITSRLSLLYYHMPFLEAK